MNSLATHNWKTAIRAFLPRTGIMQRGENGLTVIASADIAFQDLVELNARLNRLGGEVRDIAASYERMTLITIGPLRRAICVHPFSPAANLSGATSC